MTEGQDVENYYIPGAFLKTDYDKGEIHIKMEGTMVNLLEEIYPSYYKYLNDLDIRGRTCMYAEAKKTI